MNIFYPFSTAIITDQCPPDVFNGIRGEVEKNFDKINNLLSNNNWDDNVHSTSNKCKCIITELDLIEVKNYITPYVSNYLELYPKIKNKKIELHSSWVNITTKHGFQNLHIHNHQCISGVLYLNAKKDTGNFTATPQLTEFYKDSYTLEPENGLIILFHGLMPHRVEQNTSDSKRISLSFNFNYY